MNKNIKLAVAGAVLALSASAANAGIIIPAGDWTLDVNGNVNAYANWTRSKDSNDVLGGLAGKREAGTGEKNTQGINTGLLPAWLGFTGTTRQNDVDVSFTISMQPNASDNANSGDAKAPLFRQSFLTFGDKSWGSIKLGKDIGIFASDAILNDMTLLGVGGGAANSGGSTTLGGIGTGYIYAAWKGQATYTTPNFNGFQASLGITNPNQGASTQGFTEGGGVASGVSTLNQDRFGVEAKASYSFAVNDVTGKVWVSGASNKVKPTTDIEYTATVADIGANVNVANFGVTGYYYNGEGAGTTMFLNQGASATGKKRDSDGGYVQLTYKLPTNTKIGYAYGISKLDRASDENVASTLVKENTRHTVGLYHPLTKHLNLVAEYNNIQSENHQSQENKSHTGSLGAILFF
jgi:predicted porin